jgi:hypothetical protein
MNPHDVTTEAVADAIARVRQLKLRVSPSRHAQLEACLDELHAAYGKLDNGQGLIPPDAASALSIVRFVAQLERTSLATPAASALASRTPTSALRRIAQHADRLDATRQEPAQDEHTQRQQCHSPSTAPARRTPVRDLLQRIHTRKTAEGPKKQRETAWQVHTTHGDAGATEVRCEFHLRLVISSTSSLPVPAEAIYRTSDPYAVQMTFHTGADETVNWCFSRELLTAGSRTSAGAGDVQVWPSQSKTGAGIVCLALVSPEGEALMEAPAGAIQAFLRASHKVVPPGEEHKHIDFDASFPADGLPPVDSPHHRGNPAP